MWKIFAGFVAFALLALFVIMKSGDKVDMQAQAAGHSASTSESVSASAAVSVPPAPVESVPATATPATNSAPSVDAASHPRKMSTTGTVVVGATAASK